MPAQLLIRCASLAVTTALCIGTRDAPGTFLWSTYSLGFAHYFLALRYSTRQIGQALVTPPQVLALTGAGLLTFALYYGDVSLMVYFGVHHVLNESYLRRSTAASPSASWSRLSAAAVVFHAVAYVTILRSALGLSWLYPQWVVAALVVAVALVVHALLQLRPFGNRRQLLDLCAGELTAGLLIAASLFVRITFLQIVLYHFVLWALLPIEGIRTHGTARFGEYLGLSVALIGIFTLMSPLGPLSTQIGAITFSRQFLFWSYAHISLSFALSDAQPRWMRLLFRGAPRRSVSAPVAAPG